MSVFGGGEWWEGREGERKNRFKLKRGGASAGTEGRDSTRAEKGWGDLSQMAECELRLLRRTGETGSFCLSIAEDTRKWSKRPEF